MESILKVGTTRFITFTLRHNDTPLRDQLDRLHRSFRELRKKDVWTTTQEGAAAFVEVKIGKDGRWHVHLHVLAVGNFIDQKDLSKAWHAVTGDSSIVDVRLPKTTKGIATYVTKYVTKPLDGSVFATPDRLDEAMSTLSGRRLCNGSGTLRSITADTDDAGVDDWHTIGRLDTLFDDARRGDRFATEIIKELSRFTHVDHAREGNVAKERGP